MRDRDLYTEVTEGLIEALEQGVRPWAPSWASANKLPPLPRRHCGRPYSGINILILWMQAQERGYTHATWMTYRQAIELGGRVRKGERGCAVVFASTFTREERTETGEAVQRAVPFLRSYTVFNVEQIDGLPAKRGDAFERNTDDAKTISDAELLFGATGATFRHGGTRCFYDRASDSITLPSPSDFITAAAYTSAKAHELVHWTGHGSRCNREFGKRFGDDAYAFEELVAEMGAAFLCAELGLQNETREDHAGYLWHWLQVLRRDKRAIFTAATKAQEAMDFILSGGLG